MLEVANILRLQKDQIAGWHTALQTCCEAQPWCFIEENLQYNFLLWHEEDIARIVDIEPARMVAAKRNIDRYNQARNNAMEKIDEWILQYLITGHIQAAATLHSETPGMMIDRLAILQLKQYHMEEEATRPDASDVHREKCSAKVAILSEQVSDLATCLATLLEQLQSGERHFKVYRQLKMYNDPTLNPQLYAQKK